MKSVQLLTLVAALTRVGMLTGTAGAASAPVPAGLYPVGAGISYRPAVSNHTMDCLWGFSCEGQVSLFHSRLESDLHRTGGWAQFAGVHHRGQLSMAFELFASRYGPGVNAADIPWGGAALADFLGTLRAHDYHPLGNAPHLVGAGGTSSQVVAQTGGKDIVVMAAWNGRTEVEAIVAFYRASPAARRAAIGQLARQVRRAISVTSR
jgi:hypothetical protein